MARYIPDLAGASVPRYTSYPTAASFHDGVGAADQARALAAVPPGAPVSLYLHIPYCRQLCWYCGCSTGVVSREALLDDYVAALNAEIDAVSAQMQGRVISVQFGGGSPNALRAPVFAALLDRLRDRFDIALDAEIAVELDPRRLDAAYIATLVGAGVNRVSLGAQTFAAHVQARINRIQPFAMIADAAQAFRAAGLASLNLDLMYGLPGQSKTDLADTIELALTLKPDRVAMFGYAHMPRLLARQRMIVDAELPDAPARFAQSLLAAARFTATGYRAIGFDHYALPDDSMARAAADGTLRRNFQGYTTDPGTALIGLGATAISQFDDLLVQNDKHVGQYRSRARNDGLAGMRGIARNADDRLRAGLIETLLCTGRLDVAAHVTAADVPLGCFADALAALHGHARRGLVTIDGASVALTDDGWPYARLIAAAFDAHLGAAPSQFSKAV